VFIGFGLLPLICATILWLLLGELRPIRTFPQASVVSSEAGFQVS
jgi:hypothetical protein